MAGDAETAMHRLDELGNDRHMREYAPYHLARAEVLRLLERFPEASDSYENALTCRASMPVVRHIEQRLVSCL